MFMKWWINESNRKICLSWLLTTGPPCLSVQLEVSEVVSFSHQHQYLVYLVYLFWILGREAFPLCWVVPWLCSWRLFGWTRPCFIRYWTVSWGEEASYWSGWEGWWSTEEGRGLTCEVVEAGCIKSWRVLGSLNSHKTSRWILSVYPRQPFARGNCSHNWLQDEGRWRLSLKSKTK